MSNKSIIDHVKADYKACEASKHKLDQDIQKWENIRDSKPYGTEVAHKSKYVSDLTAKLLSWQIPSMVDPLVNNKDLINCKPFTYKDEAISEQEEAVLTHQFIQTQDHYSFITDLITWVAEKGTAYVKTGWKFEEEEQEVQVPVSGINPITGQEELLGYTTEKQMVTIANEPTRMVIDPLDIRVDPTCRGNLKEASFVIHDWETDLSTLRKATHIYKNLDKLTASLSKEWTDNYEDYVDHNFAFQDEARKKIIVHEYWGNYDLNGDGIAEPVVIAWVNDIVIREEDNPLPGKELPFERAVYKKVPGMVSGQPLAALTGKHQHIDSVLHRGIFDDMKLANNGQTGTKKGFTDEVNLRKMKQGLDFEYNTTMADVYQDQYRGLSSSVFEVMAKNEQAAQSAVGVNLMNHGTGGNALGSSAAAVNATTTSSAKREMHIIRGIAEECLIPVLKKFSRYNRDFLSPEEVERITDKPYVEPGVGSEYNITFVLESAETRASKVQTTGFVLQTMGPNMSPETKQLLLARYMKLSGELDIANMIENPKPNPQAEEQAKAQAYIQKLEIAKLEAQVRNEDAKGRENAVDVELKRAKTQVELAKARTTSSDADLKDLSYLEQEQGISHERELEKLHTQAELKKNS